MYNCVCADCGTEFFNTSKRALRCEECRKQRDRDRAKRSYIKRKVKREKLPSKSIRQITRELEKYNKEHGTHYTYGQFVSLLHNKKIIL